MAVGLNPMIQAMMGLGSSAPPFEEAERQMIARQAAQAQAANSGVNDYANIADNRNQLADLFATYHGGMSRGDWMASGQGNPQTLYRTDPGTREFVGVQGGAAGQPGVSPMDASAAMIGRMQAAGGTATNSPQVAAEQANYGRMGEVAARQAAAQAQVASAAAQQGQVDLERQKLNDPLTRAAVASQAGINSPTLRKAAGAVVPNEELLPTIGVDPRDSLWSAAGKVIGSGQGPVAPGSDQHGILMDKYGPEIQARLSGQPYHWYEHPGLGGMNVGDNLQLGLPAIVRDFSGAPSWKEQAESRVRAMVGAPDPAPMLATTPPPAAPQVGVPQPAAPRVKVGSKTMGRQAKFDQTRRGQIGG